MVSVLLLGMRGSCRSQMAEGFARQLAPPEVAVCSAGLEAGEIDPKAVAVMAEAGVDITGQPSRRLTDLNLTKIDLIITLATKVAVPCSALPGAPAVVRWEVPDPATAGDSDQAYRRVRDELQQRLEHFFKGGYLAAAVAMKHNSELVLDCFSDGVIVHDVNRIITWFNRAAEKITGYDRREVLGRDCHEVFAEGFCGGKCSFCDKPPNFDKLHYPLKIHAKDNHQRRVEMSVVAMRNDQGVFQGVLASFHDITEVTQLRQKLKDVRHFHGIIGADEKMQAIYELISDLAVSDCPVLIQGESGTGKELAASAIHQESRRAGRPFVTVNCGALPEGILESELFGHVRGAFTGAVRDKKGRFELADGGTMFLDEVAELSPNMQVKLLRVCQEGSFERVGDEKTIAVDVRILSATNKDLRKMVQKGQFREDLFYRLCVVPLNLPSLRERRTDIPLLVGHFIERFRKDSPHDIKNISTEAMHCLMDYDWPGNIRELQNALQYAFVKCKGELLEIEHLPPEILSHLAARPPLVYHRRGKLNPAQVEQALDRAGGNKVKAARLLGVGRATLYRFLKNQGSS